jgi:hypothetical protein
MEVQRKTKTHKPPPGHKEHHHLEVPPGGPPPKESASKLLTPSAPPKGPPKIPGPPSPPGPPDRSPRSPPRDDTSSNEQPENNSPPPPPPPPPPPAPPQQQTPADTRPSSPDSPTDSESDYESDDDYRSKVREPPRGAHITPDMIPPPPPAVPAPPPVAGDDSDFMTLDLQEDRWKILLIGTHEVLKYSTRLRSVFLWLPPAARWAKNQLVVEKARNSVLGVLDGISYKIVDLLVDVRKAWESILYVDKNQKTKLPKVNTNDDYWRWRFREGWHKISVNLKMAQNAGHCNSILRSASNLLREYKNFIQGCQNKIEQARKRDPQAGLRLSKARIKKEILKKKLEKVQKLEREKIEELKKQRAKLSLQQSNKKAQKRVWKLKMNEFHLKVKSLLKKVVDQRIKDHLAKEFEPGWRTSIELSQSYIHALKHSIILEQNYLERKRRQKAKYTCKRTLKRVRLRRREEYGDRAHVFVRPLSRLVDIRGAELRMSPIRPRAILR